jgi:hypothetical protein
MVRAEKHDANRGIHSEQREIELERDYIKPAKADPYAKANLRNLDDDLNSRSP